METTKLRLFLMGNGGYASSILENLLARGERVIGCCARANQLSPLTAAKSFGRTLVRRLGIDSSDDFTHADPFQFLPTPHHIAMRNRIPMLDAAALRRASFAATLRELAPDVIFVAGFHRLIPPEIIAIPTRAIVNFHPSLLPKHRGGTPNRWVIRNGDTETGVTAHYLTERFDDGAVIDQERIAVRPTETWGELELRVASTMTMVATRVLEKILNGNMQGIPQCEDGATYEPPYHGARQEIDWSCSAEEIRRTCYAIRPKSGGLTTFNGRRLCVWDVEVQRAFMPLHNPGTIIDLDADGCPIVACGVGQVRILKLLTSGRIVSAARAFAILGAHKGSTLTTTKQRVCA